MPQLRDAAHHLDRRGPEAYPFLRRHHTKSALQLARAASDEQSRFVGNQSGGRVFLFPETDDFRRNSERLKKKGVEFVREPLDAPFGTVAVFKDLYGNLWDLIQPKKEALPEPSGRASYALSTRGKPRAGTLSR